MRQKAGIFPRGEADPVGEMYKPGGDQLWFCSSEWTSHIQPGISPHLPQMQPGVNAFHHLLSCHRSTAQGETPTQHSFRQTLCPALAGHSLKLATSPC